MVIYKIYFPLGKTQECSEYEKHRFPERPKIQESLANFKVIIAFKPERLFPGNDLKRQTMIITQNQSQAGIANNVFTPVLYNGCKFRSDDSSHIWNLSDYKGPFLTGTVLISFIAYVTKFYNPLRQLAALCGLTSR